MALKFLLERLTADDEKAANTTAKGYDKYQFTQIWERYLSPKVDEFLF